MKIIFCDKNKSLLEKVKEVFEYEENRTRCELIISNDDVLKTKKQYKDALIVTASNPDFSMGGGLDSILKKEYPAECINPKEFKFTKNLFFVVSCNKSIQTNREIIKRALLGVFFASRKKDIILTGIGTSIAGLNENEFIEEIKCLISANFSNANFSDANFRNANFSDADFSYANFSDANFSDANFRNANFSDADFSYADFSYANFSDANFRYTNFSYANFSNADFSNADFRNADFSYADFRYTNFSYANFSNADFSNADFRNADFSYADFSDANFRNANFRNANFSDANFNFRILPEEGDIIGWKKAGEEIVKLKIDCKTAVGGMIGRKCRCKSAVVLDITNNKKEVVSNYDETFVYKKGKKIKVEDWNDKPYLECEKGIHFFITKQEAEKY